MRARGVRRPGSTAAFKASSTLARCVPLSMRLRGLLISHRLCPLRGLNLALALRGRLYGLGEQPGVNVVNHGLQSGIVDMLTVTRGHAAVSVAHNQVDGG